MKIESSAFGSFDVPEDKIIDFPGGLPGFEQCTRFTMVHNEEADPAVVLLQSVDDPDIAFSLTDPARLGIHYEFVLSDEEVQRLELGGDEPPLVTVIVRGELSDEVATPASTGLRANFMAPIVINVDARKGLQKVINKLECDVTLRERQPG